MPKRARSNRPADRQISDELDALYGPFAARHHARYHDAAMPYHVVIRALQGFALLTPTDSLNSLIAGVIGRAQTIYTSVRVHAFAFLSNHAHLMLRGRADQVPAFIGYIKKEVSRRLGKSIGWRDTMWSARYISAALPTHASHEHCLEYILSQGCKEHLVDRPEQWPGLHVAKQLLTGQTLSGRWLDGTRYGKARWKERQRPKSRQRTLDKTRYTRRYEVELTPIPAWAELREAERRRRVVRMVAEIVDRARLSRAGRPSLGVAGILRVPRTKRWALPELPWFQERRRMVAWAERWAPETRAYYQAYWAFQRAFRAAADDYLAGNVNADFPAGSFRPPIFATRLRRMKPPGSRRAAA